jgi:hypothetical protein
LQLAGAALLAIGLWLLLDDNPLKFLDGVETGNPMDDPLWSVAIYILVAVGGFVFLLGFLGCCGACMNNQCMIFLVRNTFLKVLCLGLGAIGIYGISHKNCEFELLFQGMDYRHQTSEWF